MQCKYALFIFFWKCISPKKVGWKEAGHQANAKRKKVHKEKSSWNNAELNILNLWEKTRSLFHFAFFKADVVIMWDGMWYAMHVLLWIIRYYIVFTSLYVRNVAMLELHEWIYIVLTYIFYWLKKLKFHFVHNIHYSLLLSYKLKNIYTHYISYSIGNRPSQLMFEST